MKNWLKIFKGETEATAQEIGAEMDGLIQEKAALAAKLDEVSQELQAVQIEILGGDTKAQAKEAELVATVVALREKKETLDRVLSTLQERLVEARDAEKNAELAGIAAAIEEVKKERAVLLDKFLKSAGQTAAYLKLLTGDSQVTIGRNTMATKGLELSANDRAPLVAMFDKTIGDSSPIPLKLETLLQRRADLTGQERHVNWMAWQ